MKKLLRSKYKEIRRSIIDKEDKDNIIFDRVINNTKITKADTLLIYVSTKEEVEEHETQVRARALKMLGSLKVMKEWKKDNLYERNLLND